MLAVSLRSLSKHGTHKSPSARDATLARSDHAEPFHGGWLGLEQKKLFIKTHFDTARDYIYNCLFSQDDEKLKTVTKG